MTKDCILSFDTSNYTTSVAAINDKFDVVEDQRMLLNVKEGERGLRQSHALFQHMENLPGLISNVFDSVQGDRIAAVSVSNKPRPVNGSYMPVFKAGITMGSSLAAALGVPFFQFSHQEGHIEAVCRNSQLDYERGFLAYHLSGGTCELLKVTSDKIKIIGGSLDISFGQLIDRAGVSMGMPFPSGIYIDKLATEPRNNEAVSLTAIKNKDLFFNLSGIETQVMNRIENGLTPEAVAVSVMKRIGQVLIQVTDEALQRENLSDVIFVGGVSSSKFLRNVLESNYNKSSCNIVFGDQRFSSDNAVGTAFLGGKKLWG